MRIKWGARQVASTLLGVRDGWWSGDIRPGTSLKFLAKSGYVKRYGQTVKFVSFKTLRNMANCPTVIVETLLGEYEFSADYLELA